MSLLAEFEDLVLGPQRVDGTNLRELFLNLHIDLQQVIIERLFRGDDGWDYMPWTVRDRELVIHWENFDFSSTYCAVIELLAASEVVKRVTFHQGWNDPEDWSEILRICLLVPVDKLILDDFFTTSLQRLLGIGYGW